MLPTSRSGLARAAAARSTGRSAVLAAGALLRPGRWVAAGDSLWRHRAAALPEHLRRTKGRARGMRAALRELALPRSFTVRSGAGSAVGYPLAVATYDGAVVLLDPGAGRVARTLPPDVDVVAYRERRERFAAHLGTGPFEIRPGLLTEQYVTGDHFATRTAAEQVVLLADLLERCAALVAAEGAGTAEAHVAAVLHHVADAPAALPEDLREHLIRWPLQEWARRWPLVPAATDATVRNLVVTDGRAVPIDLGDLSPAAFFEYPMGMVANARPNGLGAFLAGDLDDQVGALFAAAGADWPLDAEGRLGLLALRVALATLPEARGHADAGARFAAGAARRWRNLWG